MNMNKKRIGTSMLLCALLLGTLASCGGDGGAAVQTEGNNTPVGSETAPAETQMSYGDALPDELDFGGKDFRIATYFGGNLTNGAWMTDADARKMIEKGDGYFIHRGETLLGIGRASGDTIDWVASLQPGAGRDVLLALSHAITEETVLLTVASVNIKAVKLYENLGFLKNKELSRWFHIF